MADYVRVVLANLAGAFLLGVAFLILAIAAVAAFMLWRGLPQLRLGLHQLAPEMLAYARRADSTSRKVAHAVIDPQVRLMSTWAGVKAGAKALLGRSDRIA